MMGKRNGYFLPAKDVKGVALRQLSAASHSVGKCVAPFAWEIIESLAGSVS